MGLLMSKEFVDTYFVTELVHKKFDKATTKKLMNKISNWNKVQVYFDNSPDIQEISDCLAIELQTKKRSVICTRLYQRLENLKRSARAKAIGCYIKANAA